MVTIWKKWDSAVPKSLAILVHEFRCNVKKETLERVGLPEKNGLNVCTVDTVWPQFKLSHEKKKEKNMSIMTLHIIHTYTQGNMLYISVFT